MTTEVYHDESFENIVDTQLIPIVKHGMPILLCRFIKPESDISWSAVLVFDGNRYRGAEHQRVMMKI